MALLIFAAGGFLWFSGRHGATVGGPFTLVNGQGKTVSSTMFRGKYMLVYFGYTHCPDVCPTTLSDIAIALKQIGPKAKQVVPLFITVDPARDTPAVIQRYTALFSPRIVGLTGTAAQIATAAREYHVYYAKHVTGPGPNDYSMDHSSVMYLMGPAGRFLAPIAADGSVRRLVATLERVVS
ncbi:MAG: SCO family protein [Rhodospirillales bacterium]|nr:SCO family protein [Rhodospirillales bacterium]